MRPTVTLSPSEIFGAATCGLMRQVKNISSGAKHAYGATDAMSWQYAIEGALGECALAKYLGVYWGGTGVKRSPDVGAYDVRTRSSHSYDLIVHPEDHDDRFIWLLTGWNGEYIVHGGILAKHAKRHEWWKDPAGGRPAYFVPQGELALP